MNATMTADDIREERFRGFNACTDHIAKYGRQSAGERFTAIKEEVNASSPVADVAYWRGWLHRLVTDTFE